MAINVSQLISAPVLQDYLVDKTTGLPLAAGIVTLYQDNNRQVLKNWYYQSGTPGAYTYVPLNNPLTLSSSGTITDPNGNDTVPFFYPYSEADNTTFQPYYITIDNSQGTRQFTRQNFPFVVTEQAIPGNPTLKNLLVNSVFWRNIGSVNATNLVTDPISGIPTVVIAPSQHEGYSMPDIRFIKNANGAVDTITFKNFVTGLPAPAEPFPDQPIPTPGPATDVAPEFYLNFNCTGTGSETSKYIQIPIQLHITALSGVNNCCIVFDAMAVTGSPIVTLNIYQFLGTGTSSSATTVLQSFTLTNSWKKYVSIPFTMPSAQGVVGSIGKGGDDALYLQIGLPAGANGVCNINIAKPSLYLDNQVPTNDFQTYDEVNAITSSPRTGDVRYTLNTFQPGWVLCNDGVISNSGTFTLPTNIPSARQNVDTWPLFDLLWQNAKPVDTGSNSNPICQMYTSAGAATNFGASAIADWTANNQLGLSLMLGRILIGAPPAMNVSSYSTSAPSWNSGFNGFFTLSVATTLLYVGSPVILTGTSLNAAFTSGKLYYAIPSIDGSSATQFQLASTYANAVSGTAIVASGGNTGTSIIITFALAGNFGQSRHVQLLNELAMHSHPGPGGSQYLVTGGTGAIGGVGSDQLQPNTGTAGNSYPFNVLNPAAYCNVFLKL